ncbi:PREDICTED: putative E3 ubiquitin-protein ligase UBR7 isoform X2 [Rhagoletis zephyria]|uniref:putative E3 ubiquitin-protein ligase UBR7 isoform X2 n=1 Tax=Rhagoletis zephyria TaxID=28612 RepID=UPI0008117110|nr:PREDICTED: putative E3 ubiquitin-protein ligase UBR7 isoform X2 [Rhagoletis zephyria]
MNLEQAENPLEESSVTMVDVLQEEHELEEEYNAVLGASDEKCCTYAQGPIKRQALYSCLTCCPETRTNLNKCAGICLACSYRCHENHELIELYTKRNFRCDCPTERFSSQHRCLLNTGLTELQAKNSENLYNQNFQGLYCKCHRPYPDPDRTTDEVMLQCTVCEDWFHLHHLAVSKSAANLVEAEACGEMICGDCMQKHQFLQDYTGLALKVIDDSDESTANITVTEETSVGGDNDNKLRSDLDKSISEIMNMNGDGKATPEETVQSDSEPHACDEEASDDSVPKAKRQKIENHQEAVEAVNENTEEPCRRPKRKQLYEEGATFWGNDWRTALCQCSQCLTLYKSEKVEFLLDIEDSAKSYEERGKQRGATETTYEQGIRALASIGREMRNEKNTALGQPFFCR